MYLKSLFYLAENMASPLQGPTVNTFYEIINIFLRIIR